MGPLFAISDVHGYADDLRESLRSAGLVDADDTWTGGDARLWVLGDLLDRGPAGIDVIDLVWSLHQQRPEQVRVLMGNHEALALGFKLFPESHFAEVWAMNGGLTADQDALSDEHIAWLRSLPVLARDEDYLLMHSDTTDYLQWGTSIGDINAAVTRLLATDDVEAHWAVFASLTSRHHFAGPNGAGAAGHLLSTLGGGCLVHGHSIIGTLTHQASHEIDGPIAYAEGLAVAIDGGRYDGGPLLLVELA